MGATLRRAAYSTNIKTRGDFSCAFFDRDLRTIAQAFAQPSHLGSLAQVVPRAIEAYGADRLAAGDGILINDPYLGGVHLNDITLITPVFHEGALFGYVANIAHHVDVGGGAPGSIGVSSEIYQEGLVIPPVRFVKRVPPLPRRPAPRSHLLAVHPRAVWLQLGIRHDEAAAELARAGIQVVQDRCLLVEHRRLG